MTDAATLLLMYAVVPLWLLAGVADWICHRASRIQATTGAKESLIHLLMLAEIGVPMLAALFLEINAGIIALALFAFLAHEVTALWDVRYASSARVITPFEQHVHSFLEILPLAALLMIAAIKWPQAQALFGAGAEPADFSLRWKEHPLPPWYLITVLSAVALLEVLPYGHEFLSGLRANRGRLVPPPAAAAAPVPVFSPD